jgi:hypothetical protein
MSMDGAPTKPSFVELVLVEPPVYWRIFDLDYQAEQFEVFHRRWLTRWTHYVGTQVIVWAFLLLLLTATSSLLVGAAGALLLISWYLRMSPVVGVVAGLQVLVLLALAWLGAQVGLTTQDAIVALAIAAIAQNISHSVEPVPPVLTGHGFEPFPRYWSHAGPVQRTRLLLLNVFYLPLELVSAPRLFPVHVMNAMHRVGWRRSQVADMQARALAILESS